MPTRVWGMRPLDAPESADAIDLLDGLASRLEQARSVAWAMSEQIERSVSQDPMRRTMCGEMGMVYSQLIESQELVERLFAKLQRRGNAA
ncbi:MAG: hypothetical protein JWQ90_1687 [Hydrocarboniphaga sp.]|uniref:hypothetical protein n=1 Tax=Hydrocarboniphaga sp. TaxID=2033016 RepID=UPI00261F8801|nr:hypothetical protein [Hydrocarboniphaga sp.]MDB5969237.1 hypothetical protein [Hydrocarboniphaga sp.]